VVTVHGPVEGELGDYYRALGPGVNLVAISHDQRQARPDLPWLATVHHGMTVPRDAVATEGKGPAMWLARFSPDHGPDLAPQGCRDAGIPLVLAGKCNEPAERHYLSDVIKPMLHRDVELITNPDRACAMERLKEARCLLLPLRWREPFGMVMLEAMALGVPVVATRRGAVAEVVDDGVTGFVCESPEELPRALEEVSKLRRQDCIARVRDHFSAAAMAEGYEAVYRQAIVERRNVVGRSMTPAARRPGQVRAPFSGSAGPIPPSARRTTTAAGVTDH